MRAHLINSNVIADILTKWLINILLLKCMKDLFDVFEDCSNN